MFTKPKRFVDLKFLEFLRNRPCVLCNVWPSEVHHIRTRKAGGPDKPFNCTPLCRKHHVEWHAYGPYKFCSLYPKFETILKDMGWRFTNRGLWHDDLASDV